MKTISEQLSEREYSILTATVKDYIRTALPVAPKRVNYPQVFAVLEFMSS
ncbi:MAG: hypothetical protein GH143_10960, partial [Calditrichaeota bacterium]|nr:hypothetical protein [Calditrichota bacterium]